jgi:hypothetical protein
MKIVRINKCDAEIPTSWAEVLSMLDAAMNPYQDRRGGNVARLSVCARVAYGLFGEPFMAPDPTIGLLFLLQEVCRRKGAGLDGLEMPRRWASIDEEEKQT